MVWMGEQDWVCMIFGWGQIWVGIGEAFIFCFWADQARKSA
jgi:hypothetical protein